ncbi:hypothetical protein [Oceaniradius stylonematis]|jgi:hypothetical protein|uniref:hypothetical protein n=1 Tax=Oceaniradius stylonematis TaxID=2184161 RepID=UPI002688AD5C
MASIIHLGPPHALDTKKHLAIVKAPASVVPFSSHNHAKQTSTAIIYCEGKFGAIDGKTANGLVRHSEK